MITLTIEGMSCDHCVRAVTGAVHEVVPEALVRIDLEKGLAHLDGPAALPVDRIKAAIEEEGYTVGDAATA